VSTNYVAPHHFARASEQTSARSLARTFALAFACSSFLLTDTCSDPVPFPAPVIRFATEGGLAIINRLVAYTTGNDSRHRIGAPHGIAGPAHLSLSLSLSLSFSLSLSLSVFFARTGREKESANPPPCLAYHVRSRRRCAVGHNCSLRMQALFSAFPPPSPLSLSLLRETYFLALRVPRIYAVLPALSPCPFHVLAPSRLRYAPETPRCISSIFKRHGPSAAGSASIYKASGAPVTLGRLPLAASSRPRSDSVLRAADPLPNR